MQQEHEALEQYLETLSSDQKTQPGVVGHWSAKDVLAHLLAWEQMCLGWYRAGKEGQTPHTPAKGFTWKETPELNQLIYEQYRDQSLEDVLKLFRASYQEMLNAVEAMSEEELFTPRYYRWTNTTTLASYVTSSTCSHYSWARKEIHRGIKAR
jgi:hypothetical protein